MQEIVSATAGLSSQIATAVTYIKQQMAAQGETIGINFMRSEILPHLEKGIKESQSSILLKYSIDESELEDAVRTYINEGDVEIAEMALSMKKMYNNFGGQADIDEFDDLED